MQSTGNGPTAFKVAGAFTSNEGELVHARWMPVYVEPIIFSGERITVAVGIYADGESPTVVPTLNLEQLELVFGKYGKDLYSVSSLAIRDLQGFLASGESLENWSPNMQGVYAGSVVPTKNVNFQAILRSALTNTSLFSAKGLKVPKQSEKVAPSPDKFKSHVREIATTNKAGFNERFNPKVALYGRKGHVSIAYFGARLAVNFTADRTTATSHPQKRGVAPPKIIQLLALRDGWIDVERNSLIMKILTPERDYSEHQKEALISYAEELEYATLLGSIHHR